MTRIASLLAATALLAAWSAPAAAGDLFTVDVTSGTQNATASFTTAQQALDQLRNGDLSHLIRGYTANTIVSGFIDYRGLGVLASYPTTGTTLVFQVPDLNINQSFRGATRDDSQKQLVDYLKKNGIYGRVMRQLARVSPIDPVAGNPSSLMSQMVGRDFDSAFATAPVSAGVTGSSGRNQIGLGLAYGHFSQSSTSVDSITLPISYNINLESAPGYQIQLDLPITYVNTDGAKTGAIAFGVGLRMPMTPNWSLTPRVSVGATASEDLASAAVLGSVSVTSAYRIPINDFSVTIGNMIGYAQTMDVTIGSYSINPRINDVFIKNGVMLALPASKFGIESGFLEGSELQLFVTDTRFFGTKLYDDNHQEIGFSIGSPNTTVLGHSLRVGVTFIHASHANGGIANMGWRF